MEDTTVYISKAVKPNLILSANSFIGLLMKCKINPDKNLITYESKESILLYDKNIIQEMIKLGQKILLKLFMRKLILKLLSEKKFI